MPGTVVTPFPGFRLSGWNPDDKDPDVILSGDKETITQSGGFPGGIRSIRTHKGSGKFQARFTFPGAHASPSPGWISNTFYSIVDINTRVDDRPYDGSNNQNVVGFADNGGSEQIRGLFFADPGLNFTDSSITLLRTDTCDILLDLDNNEVTLLQNGSQVGPVREIPTGIRWYAYSFINASGSTNVDFLARDFTPVEGYLPWDSYAAPR